jgi:sugar transferase EpsL
LPFRLDHEPRAFFCDGLQRSIHRLAFSDAGRPENRKIKRIIEIIAGYTCTILSAPILITVGIMIRLQMGTPIIFRQIRAGKNGKPFVLYKFRTMNDSKKEGTLLPDEKRITRIGRLLRNTSLDELPEMINILKGDMSFVGPRPLLMQYLERYSGEQTRRHDVKPGLTGWAQINGRNGIHWDQKLKLDVWYVDNQSVRLDIKIIVLTICKVIRRDGIGHEDMETMPEFFGTRSEMT